MEFYESLAKPILSAFLVEHQESVQARETVSSVYDRFRHHAHEFVAVLDDARFLGLVSRGQLGFLLGTRFGFSLHSRHEIRGHLLTDILKAPPDWPVHQLLDVTLSRTGKAFYHDVALVDDLEHFLGVISVPALVRLQSRFMSEQISVLREQRRMERQMALTEKHALFESLIGGIAHELNNKLWPVVGFTELLDMKLRTMGPHPDLEKYCSLITSNCQESVKIIRQLLQLSRPVSDERTSIELMAVITEAVTILKFPLRKIEAELILDLPTQEAYILADASQVKQVLINLAMNALDAMEHSLNRQLRLSARIEEDWVVIEVADTGHGIPSEHLTRIFDPFFTTKTPERGTGLGLSVCLGIVKQHGGEIIVRSKTGEGTTFELRFPQAHLQKAILREPCIPTLSGSKTGVLTSDAMIRAVVIDDEEHTTELLMEGLGKRANWSLHCFNTGEEALQYLERESVDVVITDLRMPGISGFSILEWIRDFRPELLRRTLVMTGDSGSGGLDRELESFHVPVLRKPILIERLAQCCLDLLKAALDDFAHPGAPGAAAK